MTLQDKLKRLAEFDAVACDKASMDKINYDGAPITMYSPDDFDCGAKWHSERIKPLLDALIECVGALEVIGINLPESIDSSEVEREMCSAAQRILANLERVVEEMK